MVFTELDSPASDAQSDSGSPTRLAIVTSHPIQYNAPWFRHVASRSEFSVRVFYLWDYGIKPMFDPGFQQTIQWDIPLLAGYQYRFVPNKSPRPGTYRFMGLWNPSLIEHVTRYKPSAILMLGYNFASCIYLVLRVRDVPVIFRGDSHRIVRRTGVKELIRRKLISLLFRQFSAFLYVGAANYDYFRYHGVPAHKLFRAPHSVENERFYSQADEAAIQAAEWKRRIGIPEGDLVILFAGKLEPKKRPLDLLHAFQAARLNGVSLFFVGGGPLEQEVKAAAAGNDKVFFASFQNQTLMPRTYAAGDLFVLPSYGTSETWGLAVNEAMCMSRPIIVSDHVGCARDLVVPEENGLIFPAGDVAALTRCLHNALSNRERLRKWGERSRDMIDQYSYRQTTEGLIEAMRRVAAPEHASVD
jgi:glycosyltransferase involved in cell wall biosynthesis